MDIDSNTNIETIEPINITGFDINEIEAIQEFDFVEGSNRYRFTKENLRKTGKGALIAGSGALLSYLLFSVNNYEFPVEYAFMPALLSAIINACREFLKK